MRGSSIELDKEVAALGDLPREELAALWQKTYGNSPPKGIRIELLARSATWHAQAKRLGGLSPATRRALKLAVSEVEKNSLSKVVSKAVERHETTLVDPMGNDGMGISVAASDDVGRPAAAKPRRTWLSPGTRLVRDWNGKSHVVEVIEEGFVFQAKVHKSLTAIAHQITGADWSGPRFFGL